MKQEVISSMNNERRENFSTDNVDIKQSGRNNEPAREDAEIDAMVDIGQSSSKQQYYRNDQEEVRALPVMASGGNSLNSYKINYDPEPQIVRKQVSCPVVYKQEVAVRYLKPPTPPPPGPLIIKEIRANQPPPAPPVIIRQRPPRPATPPPLVIRERPPQAPQPLGPKVITRNLPPPPPPPRRVIIERLPPLPPKPRSIIVERWLPYKQLKRRVVYQRAPQLEQPQPQKNLIIQWEGAQVKVQKEFRNLGVARADPNMYVQQYGPQLKHTSALPDFARAAGFPPNMGPDINEQASSMNQPEMVVPNFTENNSYMDMNQQYIPTQMTSDGFNSTIGMVNGVEVDPSMSFNSEFNSFRDQPLDDSRGSLPLVDTYSMMNQDRSMTFDQNSMNGQGNNLNYGYQFGMPNQRLEMSPVGGFNQGFMNHPFDDAHDMTNQSSSMINGSQVGTILEAD